MSYDIYLRKAPCLTCGHAESAGYPLPYPTYNLEPIFDLALTGEPFPNPEVHTASVVLFKKKTDRPRGLCILSGKMASETFSMLEGAMKRMSDPELRNQFVALEPSNRWGDFRGACKVMEMLLDAARDYPTYIWEIQ